MTFIIIINIIDMYSNLGFHSLHNKSFKCNSIQNWTGMNNKNISKLIIQFK